MEGGRVWILWSTVDSVNSTFVAFCHVRPDLRTTIAMMGFAARLCHIEQKSGIPDMEGKRESVTELLHSCGRRCMVAWDSMLATRRRPVRITEKLSKAKPAIKKGGMSGATLGLVLARDFTWPHHAIKIQTYRNAEFKREFGRACPGGRAPDCVPQAPGPFLGTD